MNLLNATLLSGIAALTRIGAGFVANKLVAVYAGPGGLALIGHFANFTTIAVALAGGGVSTGVTQYVAEHRAEPAAVRRLLGTALGLVVLCALAASTAILIWRDAWSRFVFGDADHGDIVALAAGALLPAALNVLLLAGLAGRKAVKKIVAINVVISLAGLALFTALIVGGGLRGALQAVAAGQVLSLLVTLGMGGGALLRGVRPQFERAQLVRLGHFSAMALVSATTLPLAQMIVRDHLGGTISWEAAGYWQAVWKISDAYLMLVTAAFGSYYLPRLAELRDPAALRSEILQGYRILLPLTAVSALAIYLLREPLTLILFNASFLPMTELFAFQLIGDVLKVGSWMIAHLMLAKVMTATFILSELLFGACFVASTIYLTSIFGVVGASYAFAFSYLLYWIGMGWIWRQATR